MGQPRSLLDRLGRYLLAVPRRAAIICFVFSLLALFGVPLSGLSVLVLMLITLERGARPGAILLAWTALPGLAAVLSVQALSLLPQVGGLLLAWLLAILLRHYARFALVIEVASLLGVVAVLGAHMGFGATALSAWWTQQLLHVIAPLKTAISGAQAGDLLEQLVAQIVPVATGLDMMMVLLMCLGQLLCARWWQWSLSNTPPRPNRTGRAGQRTPSCLQKACYSVHVSWSILALMAVLGVAAYLGQAFALDALPVLILPCFLSGLSVLHHVAFYVRHGHLLLGFCYMGLVLLGLTMVVGLVVLGILDRFVSIRAYWGRSKALE